MKEANLKERGNRILKTIDRLIGPVIVYSLGLYRKALKLPLEGKWLRSNRKGELISENFVLDKEENFPLVKSPLRLTTQVTSPLVEALGNIKSNNCKVSFFYKRNPLKLKFLLIKTAAIGDTILLSSVIQEIKVSFPKASISLLCAKNNYEAAKLLDNIDEIIVFDFASLLSSLKKVIKLHKFDYVIDFAQWDKISAIISAFVKADCKVGFYRKNMYRHYAYDYYAEHSDDCHEIENYRKLLELIGIKCQKFLPKIDASQNQIFGDTAMKILPQSFGGGGLQSKTEGAAMQSIAVEEVFNKEYVVFHMFPGGSLQNLKKWPVKNWFELACKINKEYGYSILLTGAKADLEEAKAFCEMLKEEKIPFYNAVGALSLDETTSILIRSKLLVSVNTGIMHLAAALNVPLIVINGATSVKRWGPLSNNSFSLYAKLDCYPCISLGFESKCQNPKCLESISPDLVFEKVRKVVGDR